MALNPYVSTTTPYYGGFPYPQAGWGGQGTGAFPGSGYPGFPKTGAPFASAPGGIPVSPSPGTPAAAPSIGGMPAAVPSGSVVTPDGGNIVTVPGVEESYIENILRLNRGKLATVYATYENNSEWNAKVFRGIIEAAGRDHVILSDPNTGTRYLLLMVNVDYVTFEGPIAYQYPFQGGAGLPGGAPGR